MIDQELLAILACPETKEPVALAEEDLIAALNSRIARGEVKNRAGKTVEGKIDGGLVRADGAYLYPIQDEIPILLIDEAIPLRSRPHKKRDCALTVPLSTYIMVPKRGFEPRRRKALPPQDSVSTNFTTSAKTSLACY